MCLCHHEQSYISKRKENHDTLNELLRDFKSFAFKKILQAITVHPQKCIETSHMKDASQRVTDT